MPANAGWPVHTHTHQFNGPFSGTTRVGQYQKGKTNLVFTLDYTEARDSEWQWHQLGHMQICTLLQTDNHASTPPLSFFFRPDALPATQSTASKHWRPQVDLYSGHKTVEWSAYTNSMQLWFAECQTSYIVFVRFCVTTASKIISYNFAIVFYLVMTSHDTISGRTMLCVWQSNAAAIGDTSVVDNKTLSDVVKGVSKLTADDTTCRTVTGTVAAAAVTAATVPPASHLLSQDTSAAIVAPVANRLLLLDLTWLIAPPHTHTHPFNGPLSGTTQVSWYQKEKPIWILLKQETVSGSGISWAICKSAARSRQITMPAPHHSVFYRPDALPAAQPTASKHWRQYIAPPMMMYSPCFCSPVDKQCFCVWIGPWQLLGLTQCYIAVRS